MSEFSADISVFTEDESYFGNVISNVTLEDLPLEAFAKILSYLDLNDKLSLLAIAESIRSKLEIPLKKQHSDLVITNDYLSTGNRWWFSNELISFKRDIISGFKFLQHYTLFNGCLRRIRFQFDLQIGDLVYMQAFFCSKLEQLEICTLVFSVQPVKIKLDRLQVLRIEKVKEGGSKLLTLESPHLKYVHFGKLEYLV